MLVMSCSISTAAFWKPCASIQTTEKPFIHLSSDEAGPWSTTAYSAKIGMDMACLILGGAYIFSSNEFDNPKQCMSEVGRYLYDAEHPIIPKAGCGRVR